MVCGCYYSLLVWTQCRFSFAMLICSASTRCTGHVFDDEGDDVMVPIVPCNIVSDEELNNSGKTVQIYCL